MPAMQSLPTVPHRLRPHWSPGQGAVLRVAVVLVAFSATLVAAGVVALELRYSPGEVVTYSALAGVGAAGALLAGRRWWPAALGLLFAATLIVRVGFGSPWSVSTVFGIANVVEAGLFAWLADRRLTQLLRLDRQRTVLGFLLVSTAVAAAGGLVVAVGLHLVGGEAQTPWATWFIRTSADAIGFISVVPLLLVADVRRGSRRQWAELAAGAVLLAAVTQTAFVGQVFFYPFVPMAALFFLVLRLGRRGAAVLPLIVVLLSIWHTTNGVGPIATGEFGTRLGPVFVVLIYSLVAVAGSWLIAAVLAERQAAIAALADANLHLEERVQERTAAVDGERRQAQSIVGAIQDGLVVLDADRTVIDVNDAFCRLSGFTRHDLVGARPPLPWWRPEDAARVAADTASLTMAPTGQVERILLAADGTPIEVLAQAASLAGPGGQPAGMVLTVKDFRDRLRREQTEQRRRLRAEALANISGRLAGAGYTQDAVLDAVTGALQDTVADFCVVHLADRDGLLRAVATRHRDPAAVDRLVSAFGPVRPGEGMCGPVFSSGTAVRHTVGAQQFLEAVGADRADQFERLGAITIACVPLAVRGESTGVITVGRGAGREPLDDETLALLGEVAERAGLALENARLHTRQRDTQAQLRQSAKRAMVLAELSHTLGTADPDPDGVCDTAASLLVREVGDTCVIMLGSRGSPELKLAAVRSREPDAETRYRALFERRPRRTDDSGPLVQVFATGEAVLLPGVDPSEFAKIVPAEFTDYMHRYGGGSLAYVPLQIGASLTGVIAFARFPTRPDPFTDSDLTLLHDLADRVAGALERARVTAALRDSEEQFRTSFENSPVGILVTSVDSGHHGRIVKANPAVCEMFGYSEPELCQMTPVELVHPDDRPASNALTAELLAGVRGVSEVARRCIRSDGETCWIRATSSVVTRMGARYIFAYLEDVTARRQAEAELAFRALHDPLTGLPNRHLFFDHLRLALDQLRRQPASLAVCYLDLDRFKEVNDGFGHDAGDQVLAEVGRRLARTIRTVDTVSRLAGDEFAIICPAIEHDHDAAGIADRILTALDEPITIGGARLHVGASIGITVTRSPTTGPDQLLRHADAALYQAKRRGRHRWELYNDAVQHSALRHLAVQQDLRTALDEHRFRLHYQPIIDLRANRIVAVEALLRLDHPHRGLLAPDEFIDVAEESDLILPIGDWVLREACRQAADWNGRFGPLDISVNVSGRQATHLTVTEQVIAATADSGLDPSRLCLEVTEHVLIGAGESIAADLNRLTDFGVRLALDDFGTGYSSLTYLSRFPVDTVKIDRSFVAGLGESARDTAIVQAITALARSLDLGLVAEGVETPTQRDLLWTLGCRRAQGFHFARPQPAEDITRLLQRNARTAPPPPVPRR